MAALPASMYMHCMPARCSQKPEEGKRSSVTRERCNCDPAHGCWESNSGPLEDQTELLTAKSSHPLHPRWSIRNKTNQGAHEKNGQVQTTLVRRVLF